METFDLSTDDGLRRACNAAERDDGWAEQVTDYLRKIADPPLTPDRFASEEFQRLLWIDNPIAHSAYYGRWGAQVEAAIFKAKFRRQFLEHFRGTGRLDNPPQPVSVTMLSDFARNVKDLLDEECEVTPHFALYRALAALFPTEFTTLAKDKLGKLARRMGIDPGGERDKPGEVVEQHYQVMKRLEDVIGAIDSSNLFAVAERMTLPWALQDARPKPSDARPKSPGLPEFSEIKEHIDQSGHFPLDLCRQLHLGLWANERRHFAILTGISGSGKTLLACKYGEVLTGGKAPYFCVIPVQPGWTDPSFLLGYPNPLKGDSYERTRFLELLLNTRDDNPAMPHVAILDEMNLSHLEQYLAPVLSAMETGNELELHGREGDFDGVPRSIPYPKNLVLIGTVNMDETTMGLSDKILDRAFTLEFWDIKVEDWPGWDSQELPEDQANRVKGVLRGLMEALKSARLHFGYRVIDEVVSFLKQRETQIPEWDFAKALDNVIYAKVLPKLRGDDSTRVQEAFTKCIEVLETHNLEKCLRKVSEMKADLESTGSARFWR